MIKAAAQGILIVFFLLVLPVVTGGLSLCKKNDAEDSLSMRYIKGMVLMMAVFQLYAVPMILLRQKFSALVLIWLILMGILFAAALWRMQIKEVVQSFFESVKSSYASVITEKRWLTVLLAGIAIALIFLQMYAYVAYQQLDEDDSRFVVNALEAIENNQMLLNNPATGEDMGFFAGELVKDVTSPWSIYLATLSKVTCMHPVILAHTILPVVLLMMLYFVYWQIAECFFAEKLYAKWLFLIFAGTLMLFGGEARHSIFSFALTRIWQGKAVVAGVFLPLLLMWILRISKDPGNTGHYTGLFLTNMAVCLASGMGIAIGAFFVGVYGGMQSLLKKDWKMLIMLAITCIPNVLFFALSGII